MEKSNKFKISTEIFKEYVISTGIGLTNIGQKSFQNFLFICSNSQYIGHY